MKTLETAYTDNIEKYIDSITADYARLLRAFLVSEGYDIKQNVDDPKSFLKKLFKIRNFISEKLFNRTISSMTGIFEGLDKRITGRIRKIYKDYDQPVPELKLKHPSQQLKDIIKQNVELIKDIGDQQAEDLEKAVYSAIRGGSKFEDVIEEVEKQGNNGKEYAKFVSRDQVAKAYAGINRERQESSGFPGYIWIATNDIRTRASHRAVHGKFFYWKNPPIIDGRQLNPGEDYQCRCIAVPAFDAAQADFIIQNYSHWAA